MFFFLRFWKGLIGKFLIGVIFIILNIWYVRGYCYVFNLVYREEMVVGMYIYVIRIKIRLK